MEAKPETQPRFNAPPPETLTIPDSDLQLRLFKPSDAEKLLELVTDEPVTKYVPWAGSIKTVEDARDRIERFRETRQQQTRVRYALENDEGFVGYAGIWPDKVTGYYEFGFAMLSEFRGQGIGTKTVQALMGMAKDQMDAKGMIAYVNDANEASKQTVLKLGFQPTDEIDEGDRRYELPFTPS